jgi:hypothetical protein
LSIAEPDGTRNTPGPSRRAAFAHLGASRSGNEYTMLGKKALSLFCASLLLFTPVMEPVAAAAALQLPKRRVAPGPRVHDVSDPVAYRLLFRALGARRTASGVDPQAAAALLDGCEFDSSEIQAILSVAGEFAERIASIEQQPSVGRSAGLAVLQARDALVTRTLESLPSRLGRSLDAKLRDYVREHVKAKVQIIAVAEMVDSPYEEGDGYCGDGSCDSGEDCGNCPDDCGGCPPSEWCGDGSCNNGEDCGSCEGDCGACPPPGPSCGELGGDYCSQWGYCPTGYDDLGVTWDCNPCCHQGPACGAIGGDYCSQSGSCPAGYDSLGGTWDCHPCCQSEPPPPPPPPPNPCGNGTCDAGESASSCPQDCANIYVYSDESYNGANLYVYNAADTDYPGGDARLRLEVTVKDQSDGSVDATGSATGYQSTDLTLAPSYPGPEPTEVQATDDGTTNWVVVSVVVTLISDLWSKIKSLFSKTKYGTSAICFYFAADMGSLCLYQRYPDCRVTCADNYSFAKRVKDPLFPLCDPNPLRCVTYWVKKNGVAKCAGDIVGAGGFCYNVPVCTCTESK